MRLATSWKLGFRCVESEMPIRRWCPEFCICARGPRGPSKREDVRRGPRKMVFIARSVDEITEGDRKRPEAGLSPGDSHGQRWVEDGGPWRPGGAASVNPRVNLALLGTVLAPWATCRRLPPGPHLIPPASFGPMYFPRCAFLLQTFACATSSLGSQK